MEKQPSHLPGPGMKRLTIDIPENVHRLFKSGCAYRGTKMSDVIREFLETEFRQSNQEIRA